MNCRHCNTKLETIFCDLQTCPPSNAMVKFEELNKLEAYLPLKVFVCSNCWLVQTDEIKKADFYLFYTEWCPHSKKSKPIIDKVKRLYDGKPINGIIVHFHEVNGEKEEDKMNEFEKRHNVSIDGYPTIYLVKGDQVIEYDANPTQDSVTEFLNTAL